MVPIKNIPILIPLLLVFSAEIVLSILNGKQVLGAKTLTGNTGFYILTTIWGATSRPRAISDNLVDFCKVASLHRAELEASRKGREDDILYCSSEYGIDVPND